MFELQLTKDDGYPSDCAESNITTVVYISEILTILNLS